MANQRFVLICSLLPAFGDFWAEPAYDLSIGLIFKEEGGGDVRRTSALVFLVFATELFLDRSYRLPLVPLVCWLSVWRDKKSKAGSCCFSVIFLWPKAPVGASSVLWFLLWDPGEAGVPTVKNVPGLPVPGKNWCEFIACKSRWEAWDAFGEKNFLDLLEFISGLILSYLNKAKILSCLADKPRFEVRWVYCNFGNKAASFFSLVLAAYSFTFFNSFSSIPAPLRSASLCCRFSSSYTTNSFWSSLKRAFALSSSL